MGGEENEWERGGGEWEGRRMSGRGEEGEWGGEENEWERGGG